MTVHYDATGDGASFACAALFHVNMDDFGITVPSYLGHGEAGRERDASFHVTGT